MRIGFMLSHPSASPPQCVPPPAPPPAGVLGAPPRAPGAGGGGGGLGGESLRIGFMLSQGGEFAFVLLSLAAQLKVLPENLNQVSL